MVEVLKANNKYCTGCGACYNVCPVEAIQMVKDPQGFFYPHIDHEKCIECKKCEDVCPKLNPHQENALEPDCYAARASDEIRKESSSGGIFTLLANWTLNQKGVVCGAAMSEDYSVKHICVETKEDLAKLRKSKYVQSDMGHVYSEISHYLKQGRVVLFTGCPCQVAAVKNYVGSDCENLYCADLLCHGVPSEQMWKDYVQENFDLNSVETIEFRSKENGWRADQLRVFWKDGSSESIPWPQSAYEEGFQRNIALRDGCEDCEFAGHQRQGDLTIGDFWRVHEYNPELDDRKGTSVILVNNSKGQKLLDTIKGELIDLQSTPIEAARYNRINQKFASHPQKERFKLLYPGHSFSDAVMQCRHSLYDIGLVGIYAVDNYGGELTQYGLYSALTEWGYSVLMIECPLDSKKKPHPDGAYLFKENPYPWYACSRYFNNIAEMKFLNLQCKTFVTGSDQMFNNNLYNDCNKYMTLNFVTDNHRKIAYAASFGHDRIWGKEIDRASESYFLRKFDYFSVREDSAVDLCKREFGVDNATWVLDPVFLCPQENYDKMVKSAADSVPSEPYLFAYILDPNAEKESVLRGYAKRLNLTIRAVSDAMHPDDLVKDGWTIDTKFGVSMEEWLAHIAKSEFYITDSFHGMCIAIIFKKQFLVLVNKLRGETRFTSLLRLLGLEDRMVYSLRELREKMNSMEKIDYSNVYEKLNSERKRCKDWLIAAIETDKTKRKPLSEFDILDSRCDDLCLRFDQKCDDLHVKLNQKCVELERRLQDQSEFEQRIESQLQDIYRSRSWRIGRIITWLPRKTRGGIQCLKDNGLAYTIKRVGQKVKNKLR